jgi:hypothetical protein
MKPVEQLSLAEVDDVVRDGDLFKVALRVLGATTVHLLATTVHLLKMPSAKDVFEYRPILYSDVSGGCSVCRSGCREVAWVKARARWSAGPIS